MPQLRRYSPSKLCDGAQMAIFGDFLRPVFAASREHNISDLHSKFALGPRHVYQIPNYLLKDKRLAEVAYPCACSQCRKSLYGSISQTRLSCMSKLPGRCALICAPAEIRRHPSIMRHSFSSLSVDSAQLDVTRCDSADARVIAHVYVKHAALRSQHQPHSPFLPSPAVLGIS